jgi:hypothetical protein
MILLVIWIVGVTIVPRVSVLLAGRAVEVPTVDEISSQKAAFASSLWSDFRSELSNYKSDESQDIEKMMSSFNNYMDSLTTARDKKMSEYARRLNENRYNRQLIQQKVAFNLARISPAASLSLATSSLGGTSLEMKNRFRDNSHSYQKSFADFMKEKTGMNVGGRIIVLLSDDDEEEKDPIDFREIPVFEPERQPLSEAIGMASVDMGLLALFNLIFFTAAFVTFGRYDAR